MSHFLFDIDLCFLLQGVQDQYEELTRQLESTSYVSNSLYTESWLRSFLSVMEQNSKDLNVSISTEAEFIQALKEVKWAHNFNYLAKFKLTLTSSGILAFSVVVCG